jgi:DNA-binding NtrC family response regulator
MDAVGIARPIIHPPSLSQAAERVRARAIARWGEARSVDMIGASPPFLSLLDKLEKVGPYRESVMITGESGVGKEQVAQALYLLGQPAGRPYVSVNCPQFQDGNLTVSELFGHRKGSFTGAIADRAGAFEQAHGGLIFLDEIGDLQAGAQAMLLRALATGEFTPVGATQPRRVDVRIVAATNRPLNRLMLSGEFRHDLFFRLRHFHLDVPPLRARGDDWRLIFDHQLVRLHSRYGVQKRLAPASEALLSTYGWPGNVRQLIAVATTGYALADGCLIEPDDFAMQLEGYDPPGETPAASRAAPASVPLESAPSSLYRTVVEEGHDFWETVSKPFLARDLNRSEVRAFVEDGLRAAAGSYRRLLTMLRLPESDYQRFMDFLRHHDLKP